MSKQKKVINPKIRSLYIGASWDKTTHKWRAQFTLAGKKVYLGQYEDDRVAAILHSLAIFINDINNAKTDPKFKVWIDSLGKIYAGQVGPIPNELIAIVNNISRNQDHAIKLITPEMIGAIISLIPVSIKCTPVTLEEVEEVKEFDFDMTFESLFSKDELNTICSRPVSPNFGVSQSPKRLRL